MGLILNTSNLCLMLILHVHGNKEFKLSLLDVDSQSTRKLDVKVVDILKFKQGFGC